MRTPRLYLVTTPDEQEIPLYCSESQREVAEYLGISYKALTKQLCLNRNGKGSKKALRYKLFEIAFTKEELKEVTDE